MTNAIKIQPGRRTLASTLGLSLFLVACSGSAEPSGPAIAPELKALRGKEDRVLSDPAAGVSEATSDDRSLAEIESSIQKSTDQVIRNYVK